MFKRDIGRRLCSFEVCGMFDGCHQRLEVAFIHTKQLGWLQDYLYDAKWIQLLQSGTIGWLEHGENHRWERMTSTAMRCNYYVLNLSICIVRWVTYSNDGP